MKTTENYLEEIKEIRKMMQESSRFLLFSGLSVIIIGLYALIGSYLAYLEISKEGIFEDVFSFLIVPELVVYGAVVLILSLITVLVMTYIRVKKAGKKIWNPGSRLMLINLAVPLISGGIFILIMTYREIYEFISPACLIFYGLALVNASKYSRPELFYIGILEITLGILAALFLSASLLFWAIGFGVVHIIYGAIMYFNYEYKTNE